MDWKRVALGVQTGGLSEIPYYLKNHQGGGTDINQASTLTADQKAYLAQLNGVNSNNLQGLSAGYNDLINNPVDKFTPEFEAGVVNPAMSQLSQAIADTQHSSNLHSSANRYATNQLKNSTLNNIAGLRYNGLMTNQQLQSQRQLAGLQGLAGLSGQGLGVNGVENVISKKPGLLDYLNTGANIVGALK